MIQCKVASTGTARTVATALALFVLLGSAWAGPKFKTLHSFAAGIDGAYPEGAPVIDHMGNLYGVTEQGGTGTGCSTSGCGTMYELHPNGAQWSEKNLYDFSATASSDFLAHAGALTMDPSGNFYGVNSYGGDPTCDCGEIYQLTRTAGVWTETTIHDFTGSGYGSTDGGYPGFGVLRDSSGNLYGVTVQGGAYGNGAAFKIAPNGDGTWTESLIYSFSGSRDGANPYSPLVMDTAGNLYGTTQQGGVYDYGTVFRLAPSSVGNWTETTLYDFTGGAGGGNPDFGVVLDSSGNIYGAADTGGSNFAGVVYKLTPTKGIWNFVLVHTFSGNSDGGNPSSTVTMDAGGNLYGTTAYGGLYQYGTVYKISSVNGKWVESVLHSFTGGSDGWQPYGGLVVDAGGNVFGTASQGGRYGFGVEFEITQ